MSDQISLDPRYLLETVDALRQHYKPPIESVALKTVDRLDDYCRQFIAQSPFAVFATGADTGLDCSPKGDGPGFIHVQDDHTLLLPDRPGNNRIDGLQNLVQDPRVGLIFFIPGLDEALRINGRAAISIDPALLRRFPRDKKLPRSIVVIHVEEVFIHCGRAIHTAQLWDPERYVKPDERPDLTAMFQSHVEYSRSKLAATPDSA